MNHCNNNLRQLDGAIQQWALERKKLNTDTPTEGDLKVYLSKHGFPKCPGGGSYTIRSVAQAPICSISSHCLPIP